MILKGTFGVSENASGNHALYESVVNEILELINLDEVEDSMYQLMVTQHHSGEDDYIQILRDVESGLAVHKTRLSSAFPVIPYYPSRYLKENDWDKGSPNTVSNRMYYYEPYDVFVAFPQVIFTDYTQSLMMVFARDEESAVIFADYYAKSVEDYDRQFDRVYRPTSHGVSTERIQVDKSIKMDDVIMDAAVKGDIVRSIENFFTDDGSFYKKYNIPYKRGILLYGPPGNGKTTIIKAIGSMFDVRLIYWQVNEYTDSGIVEEVFRRVEDEPKMILIIEDIDSLPKNTRSTFLNKLDGATFRQGSFIIATTNYPENIDSALFNRAGRFDRAYEIKKPTAAQRFDYLSRKGALNFVDEDSLHAVAKATEDFSMAVLNEIYLTMAAAYHHGDEIDIFKTIKEIKTMSNQQEKGDFTKKSSRSMGFAVAEDNIALL